MYTFKRIGNVHLLTYWRVCCRCCRMINCNREQFNIGNRDNFVLFEHVKCPPQKERDDAVRVLQSPGR